MRELLNEREREIEAVQKDWSQAVIIGSRKRYEQLVREDIPYLLAQLREARGKLEVVEDFVEEHFKDGVCLWCEWRSGQPMDEHGCWVGALDHILHSCETCGGSGEIDDLPWQYLPKSCDACQEEELK